jgi:hypothetical protein
VNLSEGAKAIWRAICEIVWLPKVIVDRLILQPSPNTIKPALPSGVILLSRSINGLRP